MKYIGKVYDGRWKVVSFHPYKENCGSGYYTLENIYNGEKMVLSHNCVRKIDSGLTTVSKVMVNKFKLKRSFKW